jgi:WD40 repeat protein
LLVDQSGKIRIWDTVNKEHLLKNEYQPIGGPIKDIAWSPDNQRMVAVGEGRERLKLLLIQITKYADFFMKIQ